MYHSVVSNSQVVKTTCVEESRKLAAYESDSERLIGEAFSSFFWFENATAIAFTFCENFRKTKYSQIVFYAHPTHVDVAEEHVLMTHSLSHAIR